MPIKYVEPKKWKNKQEIEIPDWNEKTKETAEKLIEEIPEGSEAKIMIATLTKIKIGKRTKKIKRKKEHCNPYMGNWEYEIFKGIIGHKIPMGASVKIKIFWNEKQRLIEERERKLSKQIKKIF